MSSNLGIPLSVLDLSPVSEGSSPGEALRNSLDLVRRTEALGYTRYWVAEHHNMPGIASSAPAVLLAHLASVTSRIRLGSGGVMLPNHSPLVIAEQFGMLEALHPDRIDLGLGRAPGTDQLTAWALRRGRMRESDDFPEQLVELFGYFEGRWPEGHPFARITATPGYGNRPAIWLLGSSDYGAQAAGLLGLPYSFAHHFAPAGTDLAVRAYRESFRPSAYLQKPYLMIGVSVVCAETDERASWLAGTGALSFVRFRTGHAGLYPSPDEAATHHFSAIELEILKEREESVIIGDPRSVREGLARLVERTGADELMITTTTYVHADRIRSYELVAEATALERRAAPQTRPAED
jgi:luciferase family oxidoreductase group 1